MIHVEAATKKMEEQRGNSNKAERGVSLREYICERGPAFVGPKS